MSIKISKIIYFSSTFKLNERKKVPFKKWFIEETLQENFCYGQVDL